MGNPRKLGPAGQIVTVDGGTRDHAQPPRPALELTRAEARAALNALTEVSVVVTDGLTEQARRKLIDWLGAT